MWSGEWVSAYVFVCVCVRVGVWEGVCGRGSGCVGG